MNILEVKDLTKYLKKQKVLDNLNFVLKKGEVLGFLGPNGAGKTTTIRIITGLYRPSAGRVFIAGIDAVANPIKTKGLFGVCTQDFSYNAHYNIEQDLYFYARLYGLPRQKALERARLALQWADLTEHSKKNGAHLSGGMQKKVLFARAMINDPPLLLLDEPTTGLDVRARKELWDLIQRLKSQEKSIFLTTHYLEEAEQLCDRVIIINQGKLVAQGSPEELRKIIGKPQVLSVELKESPAPEEMNRLNGLPGVKTCHLQGKTLEVTFNGDSRQAGWLVQEVCSWFNPLGFSLRQASLEEVFLKVTGKDDEVNA